ncbi:BTB/POZ domain-containing protein axundead isoform X2 [Leptinotarsa decemlineata]|uniref:BTB/POZ domain-containing protein axundead isoform X2 n=1 Tax=Leptinotarsa decemlineata TaxID=7539 RepID=UPI003D305B17
MTLKVESEQNEESKPILASSCGDDDSYLQIQNVYHNITSSMKADPLTIKEPKIALDLFSTAVKIQNEPLAKQCIDILNNHRNKKNVILILQHLCKCKDESHDPYDIQPSAPPMVENEDQRNQDWVQNLIDNLRNNCLLEIDKNADYVLKQKEILDLGYHDMLGITTRDTLEVSSEILVYSAIMRWCIEECKRRTLQTQKINLKAVLRDLAYAPS